MTMTFMEYELFIKYFIDAKIVQVRLINFTINLDAYEGSTYIIIDNDVLCLSESNQYASNKVPIV